MGKGRKNLGNIAVRRALFKPSKPDGDDYVDVSVFVPVFVAVFLNVNVNLDRHRISG